MPVYEALGAGTHSQKALAEATGLDPKTVRTALHALAEMGLAARQSAHRWTADPQTLSTARVKLHSRTHQPLTAEAAQTPTPDLTDAHSGGSNRPINPSLQQIRDTDLMAILGGRCQHTGHEDPLQVYVDTIAAVYGVDYLRVYMLESYRHRFEDLQLALSYHEEEGTLTDGCVACFIERMAARCKAWIELEGRGYVYPQVLASAGMVGWYARLYGASQRDKEQAAAWYRRRGLFHDGWQSGYTEQGDRVIRQGPHGWALVAHPDGQTEVINIDGQVGTALDEPPLLESPPLTRQPLDEHGLPIHATGPDDPVLHHHNDGWITRRAADGQHYLDWADKKKSILILTSN